MIGNYASVIDGENQKALYIFLAILIPGFITGRLETRQQLSVSQTGEAGPFVSTSQGNETYPGQLPHCNDPLHEIAEHGQV